MNLILILLIVQGFMGAFDTLYHHELTQRLPVRLGARKELAIHAVRALLYSLVFTGLAWFEWHGLLGWIFAGLILVEILLTLWDFVVEDNSRKLPASERVLHTILAINGGAIFGLLSRFWIDWIQLPSNLSPVNYGWISWVLSLFAIGVFLSGLRDAFAASNLSERRVISIDFSPTPQKVLITGGTGFIGEPLVKGLIESGSEITLLTRDPLRASFQFQGRVRCIQNFKELTSSTHFDAVINLAGASVAGGRWSEKRRKLLLKSRLDTTHDLVEWIKTAKHPPRTFVQASAVGYYGCQSTDRPLNETAPAGKEFMSDLCREWEDEASKINALNIRLVTLRLGLVFDSSGGALPMMLLSYQMGLGATLGNGKQPMSWIHLQDVLQIFAQVLSDQEMSGTYNAVAPDTITQGTFAQTLGSMLHRPVWLRIPASMLALLLGEMSHLFTKGQQAVPERLQNHGYQFAYPKLTSAIKQITGAQS